MLLVDNATYGLLTPALSYVMACLGVFLGLRCASRARPFRGAARARWLLLGGVAIGGSGTWLMHFIAMLGVTVPGRSIRYSVPLTLVSLLVAVAAACAGLLIAGFGPTRRRLALGGLIAGLGLAGMHYLGLAAVRWPGRVSYDPVLFALSIVIAIAAATAALQAAVRLRGLWTALVASLGIGIAVSGMYDTGMAAMRLYRASGPALLGGAGGATALSFLVPLIVGISVVSFLVSAAVAWSPTEDEVNYDAALVAHIRSRSAAPRSTLAPLAHGAPANGAAANGAARDGAGAVPPWAFSELHPPAEPRWPSRGGRPPLNGPVARPASVARGRRFGGRRARGNS